MIDFYLCEFELSITNNLLKKHINVLLQIGIFCLNWFNVGLFYFILIYFSLIFGYSSYIFWIINNFNLILLVPYLNNCNVLRFSDKKISNYLLNFLIFFFFRIIWKRNFMRIYFYEILCTFDI